ncbi:hypothetical protein N0V94_004800 [Neodidymelliopsis sp. IMI 364377]|nr:hypothetical protein N0V94_004800 [Neodidymelliopsis sp. IMI 364377]
MDTDQPDELDKLEDDLEELIALSRAQKVERRRNRGNDLREMRMAHLRNLEAKADEVLSKVRQTQAEPGIEDITADGPLEHNVTIDLNKLNKDAKETMARFRAQMEELAKDDTHERTMTMLRNTKAQLEQRFGRLRLVEANTEAANSTTEQPHGVDSSNKAVTEQLVSDVDNEWMLVSRTKPDS